MVTDPWTEAETDLIAELELHKTFLHELVALFLKLDNLIAELITKGKL